MAEKEEVLSHWTYGIDGLNTSSEEFYTAVENNLKERQLPNIKMKRVKLKEGGVFSSKRVYLRVAWKDLRYEIGAAPFGTTYFFSAWLSTKVRFLEPGAFLFDPETFYRADAAHAFGSVVIGCIADAIDNITKPKGLRALTEAERKPDIRTLFKK